MVVPTRGRETRLAFGLEALAAQTLPGERFEVIVVRDEDAEPPLVQAPEGPDVRFLALPGVTGPTAKRNLGWRETRPPLIAFTDDDCRPSPGWLEGLLAAGEGPRRVRPGARAGGLADLAQAPVLGPNAERRSATEPERQLHQPSVPGSPLNGPSISAVIQPP